MALVHGHKSRVMALPSQPAVTTEERSSSEWSSSSLKGGRTARFAEATMIHSPTSPGDTGRSPFADPPSNSQTPPDVSDLGFGYVAASDPAKHVSHHDIPANDQKGSLKVPGTPGRTLNPLSPTFREEFFVEKQEKVTEKENQRDLVSECERTRSLSWILTWVAIAYQVACSGSQGVPSFHQPWLQYDRPYHSGNDTDCLQRDEVTA